MPSCKLPITALVALAFVLSACQRDDENATPNNQTAPDQGQQTTEPDQGEADQGTPPDMKPAGVELGPRDPLAEDQVYTVAHGCYHLAARAPGASRSTFAAANEGGDAFAFGAIEQDDAARFVLKPSDLATYLLYDSDAHYMLVEEETFVRKDKLESDLTTLDDAFLPGAQWRLEISPDDPGSFLAFNLRTQKYLGVDQVVASPQDAALLDLVPTEGCAEYPELTLDAMGEVTQNTFDDGDVWGIVDTHSHIMSNFGFGGAGIFHGSPYHALGVEHALPDCEMFHGKDGRQDLFGYGFDKGSELDPNDLLVSLVTGRTPEANHNTDGYPTFTDWPNAPFSSTHQTQYYRWIQRAYMGGLRLVVQHATTNQIICELLEGSGAQPTRYGCNEMVAVDRIIDETRKMERYIDAQHGGPGKGWFRVVESPAQAREVIKQGKLAVVLGIETSNIFDCFLVPGEGESRCTEADVTAALDEYYEKGVRVIFPVHKYDNAFSAGDGSREIIELGNFAMTGHFSNFTDDCPDLPSVFDKGDVSFGNLNMPRMDYLGPPPNDVSGFGMDPIKTLVGYADLFMGAPLQGDYCQNAGLTDLGEFLIEELMARGMVIEIDHLPRRSYERAFEMLVESDYPAVGTHGNNNNGKLYELGGVSKTGFHTCADPETPNTRVGRLTRRIDQITEKGAYPAEGFGFDLNGFAGYIKPRFGEKSTCPQPQANPVEYPFNSYDGAITFTEPRLGERSVDYNTEGFVHLGMLPELIEDVRRDGATDAELEPLFRSAEGYIRMWERAERRSAELANE